MITRTIQFTIAILSTSFWIGACTEVPSTVKSTTPFAIKSPLPSNLASPSPTSHEMLATTAIDQPTITPPLPRSCSLGLGLRRETVDLIIAYKDYPGLVMAGSSNIAEKYFSELGGWIRVIGGPSLEALEKKAERAATNGTPYEAIGYGLETSNSTPAEEWQNLTLSTEKSQGIADIHNKLLLMGPGFRLMSENEDLYGDMAALADIWIIQTQRLQVHPPDPDYREEVIRVIEKIKSGNPDISIWAQITFPPDREPDANEWLAYHNAIVDMVDGTYIGVYNWDVGNHEKILTTINTIFSKVCGGSD